MAPYNTGQFLLEDRMCRDQEATNSDDDEQQSRRRTISDNGQHSCG